MDAKLEERQKHIPAPTPAGWPWLTSLRHVGRWVESRSEKRVALRCPAIVLCDLKTYNAMIRDISLRGIGLSGIKGLAVGDPVTVQIAGLLNVDCWVMWTKGGDAGLRIRTTG